MDFLFTSSVILLSVAFTGFLLAMALRREGSGSLKLIFGIYSFSYLIYLTTGDYSQTSLTSFVNAIDFAILPFLFSSSIPEYNSSDSAEKWRIAYTIITSLLLFSVLPVTLFPDSLVIEGRDLMVSIYVFSVVIVICLCVNYQRIVRKVLSKDENAIPGERLPKTLLRHNLFTILFFTVNALLKFFIHERTAIAAMNILTTIVLVSLLYSVLSSNLELVRRYEEKARNPEKSKVHGISFSNYYKIKTDILNEVNVNKAFLKIDYSLDDLASDIHCSRTYASTVCTYEFGGFYNLINKARLEYVDAYMETHPGATQEDIAESCGFSSRQSLIYARKKLL